MQKEVRKIYRAKLDDRRLTKVVGWPRYAQTKEKKTFWATVRAMLF